MKVIVRATELYPFYYIFEPANLQGSETIIEMDDALVVRLMSARKELIDVQIEVAKVLHKANIYQV